MLHHLNQAMSVAGLLGAGLVLSSATQAALLTDVNFNGVTIPTPPGYAAVPVAAPTPGVTATAASVVNVGAGNSVRIYDGFTDATTQVTLGGSGNHVLVMEDTSASTNASVKFAGSAQPTSGTVRITFDLMVGSGGNANLVLGVMDDADATMAEVKLVQNTGAVVGYEYADTGNKTATLKVNNQTASFARGQALAVMMEVDLDTNQFKFSLNGTLWSAGSLAGDPSYTMDIKSNVAFGALTISEPTASTGRVAVDNVRVELIPEPASLGALGLGTLLLWCGRDRK